MFHHRALGSSVVLFVMLIGSAARAQQPKPIEKVQGVTGRFQAILTERSPLSNPSDVAKRISQKPGAEDKDYDLSKEVYEAFVPKSPGDDGKYGLMVPMPFPAHGFPPSNWIDSLEAHHLIWLGASNGGDTRPAAVGIGLALDAVHNAEKAWQIDPTRVYVCPAGGKSIAQGIALYYPDVFQGQLCSAVWSWYAKIQDPRARIIYPTDTLAKPQPEQMSLAKTRTRFFFAGRASNSNTVPGSHFSLPVIVQEYERIGFKHVKVIWVPDDQMTLWSHYPASWFEQGVEFLDAGAAEANATAAKTATAKPTPTPADTGAASPPAANAPPASAPPSAASPDDANRKAASALSLAKNYVNAGQYETARKKLQSLLDAYPASPSAAEAKALLDEIKDK